MSLPFCLVRPVLHALDPETAHRATIAGLAAGFGPRDRTPADPALRMELFGLDIPNPVGLAAGFDKDAEVPDAMLAAGFGFVEVGTITPRPQAGNPRPRIFRLPEDRAVVNRLGFNNGGLEAAKRRLAARMGKPGLVGANIGANKDADDRVADYVTGLKGLHGLCAFFTVNISSPNTPGLRDLQGREALARLLDALVEAREGLTTGGTTPVPLLLKIAPDVDEAGLDDIVEVVLARPIDGMIVSNTTIARPETLQSAAKAETGGLSGEPLFAPSTEVLRQVAARVQGRIPLVGVGGIHDGASAYAKIRAGASLVELYSALVYEGPALVGRIRRELCALLARDGFTHLSQAVGADQRASASPTTRG